MTKQEIINYVAETPHNVNKNILAQRLDDLQKNVSWNDLKDKPFYTETEVILEKQTLEFSPTPFDMVYVDIPNFGGCFAPGEQYVVVLDGQRYTMTAPASYELGDYTIVYFHIGENGLTVNVAGTATSHEIGIYRETIHQLDGKYVKGMGYTEMVEEVILPETEFDYDDGKAGSTSAYEGDNGYIATPFVLDEHYTVVYDGTEYDCVGTKQYSSSSASSFRMCVGNPGLKTSYNSNNGMPFCVISSEDADGDWYTTYEAEKGSAYHTFEIRQKVETAHTIDPKYLPCDLMFKVGCAGNANPKYDPAKMTKPTIVSGSLEAVLEKMANGEIPVVKVQYQGWFSSGSYMQGYGGEFTCDTFVYGTDVMFCHDIPHPQQDYTVLITMATDDPSFMQMSIWTNNTVSSPSVVID